MRVLIHSNAPWIGSGYGQGTAIFAERLREQGIEVAISASAGLGRGMVEWRGFPVYPVGRVPFGVDIVNAHASHWKADVVLALLDSWVLKEAAERSEVPWVFWSPVDQAPLPPRIVPAIEASTIFGVFSRWGVDVACEHGTYENVRYLPLGVDTEMYKPMPQQEARLKLGLPQERFIAGIVAANSCSQGRKAWGQQLEGFSIHQAEHPDSLLYLHTDPLPVEEGGWNVSEMVAAFGIERRTLATDRYKLALGVSAEYMRALYSSFDVLLACSAAEGFGMPILEAQACGTPVIVGNWSSMPELFGEGVIIDPKDAMRWKAVQGGFWYYPQPDVIAEALNVARFNDWNADSARAFAKNFDSRKVTTEHLIPVLQEATA